MASNRVFRASIHYLLDHGVKPDSWKDTEKSLVYYQDGRRTVVPLTDLLGWYSENHPEDN